MPRQLEVALADAAGLEQHVPQAEALAASRQRVRPLRVARPEVALEESEGQPEVALVLPRAVPPQASPQQEAPPAEPRAPQLLPSFG